MGGYELMVLAALGLFAGSVGGMLGVGGSIVMIPGMIETLGPNQHLYQASAMIVNFFVVVPAVWRHGRAGVIDLKTVLRIAPLSGLAVMVGVAVSELAVFSDGGEVYLRGMFGLFLLMIALYDLYRLVRSTRIDQSTPDRPAQVGAGQGIGWRQAAIVAIPVGLLAGVLGIGGGILAVPLQRRILKIPIGTAIANSAAIIIVTSLLGSCLKNYALVSSHGFTYESFVLAAILIPTAVVGSLFGSHLTHRVPTRLVKAAFFILLVIASLRLLSGAKEILWPVGESDSSNVAQILRMRSTPA